MDSAKAFRFGAIIAAAVLLVTGCGQPGSSGGNQQPTASPTGTAERTPEKCEPVTGDDLVVLADDKHLQTVDNIAPAVNSDAAEEPLLAAVNAVSAALNTELLTELNRNVVVDRQTSSEAARAFANAHNLTVEDKSGSGAVTVGAGNFAESATLAELYGIVLTEAGYDVTVRTIGNRETYLPALESGELTVVPEYVGTLTEFLNKQINGSDAKPLASGDLTETTAALTDLAKQVGLTIGTPSEAADQNAFAVTKAFADKHGVKTLSDLAAACGGLVLGGPPECPDRPFCEPGLKQTYGMDIASFTSLDAGGPLTKAALRQGEITVGLVFSSDGSLGGDAVDAQ